MIDDKVKCELRGSFVSVIRILEIERNKIS